METASLRVARTFGTIEDQSVGTSNPWCVQGDVEPQTRGCRWAPDVVGRGREALESLPAQASSSVKFDGRPVLWIWRNGSFSSGGSDAVLELADASHMKPR